MTTLPSPDIGVLACVDRSAYSRSVCDHTAWLASALTESVTVLHVDEALSEDQSIGHRLRPPLITAIANLADQGADDVTPVQCGGKFADVGVDMANRSAMVVMGKRGVNSDGDRRLIGSSVYPMLTRSHRPICLVSQHYLPASHGLVLIDGDPAHRRTVEFVATHPALTRLNLDVVLIEDELPLGDSKLTWARTMLGALDARTFKMEASGPDEAVQAFVQSRGYDLLILSREIVLRDIDDPFATAGEQSFWSWRAPVLVC